MPIVLLPITMADQCGHDGQAHRDQRAEGDREDQDGHQDADHLAVAAGRRRWRTRGRRRTRPGRRRRGGPGRPARRRRSRSLSTFSVSKPTVAKAVSTVLADGRAARVVGAAHGDHVRAVLRARRRPARPPPWSRDDVSPSSAVEDDVGGVERLLREAVLDGVGRALRLGAREAEALVGWSADRRVEHEDRAGDHHPGGDDSPGVTAGEVPDLVEEVRHGKAFRLRSGGGRLVRGAGHGDSFSTGWKRLSAGARDPLLEGRNSAAPAPWRGPHTSRGGPRARDRRADVRETACGRVG